MELWKGLETLYIVSSNWIEEMGSIVQHVTISFERAQIKREDN